MFVDVCGSSDTRLWLESNARRLLSVKANLAAELQKYEVVTEKAAAKVPLVEMHLRQIMKSVAALKNRLAIHRPDLAAKYKL